MEAVRLVLLAVAGALVGGVGANFVAPALSLRDIPRGSGEPLPPRIKLEHPRGGCVEVSPHGAHVLSWKIPDHSEVIYLSPQAKFGENDAVRGGIPICFPQFGPKGALPQHGFARKSNDWVLGERAEAEDGSKIEFVLKDTEATRSSAWPHPFELRYEIAFDGEGELVTKMKLRNTGDKEFDFTCALHTYFCVEDIKETTVEGLKGVEYDDALDEANPVKTEENEVIKFEGNVDRVYGPTPLVLRIVDSKKGRCISIAKDFPDVVVWNPWEEKAKAMGDLPDDAYHKFVCVEVGAIRKPVTVKAGEEWVASQKLTVSGN